MSALKRQILIVWDLTQLPFFRASRSFLVSKNRPSPSTLMTFKLGAIDRHNRNIVFTPALRGQPSMRTAALVQTRASTFSSPLKPALTSDDANCPQKKLASCPQTIVIERLNKTCIAWEAHFTWSQPLHLGWSRSLLGSAKQGQRPRWKQIASNLVPRQ